MSSTFPSLPSPPPSAQRFRSDDLDEVREFVRRAYGEHSRVAHRAGALGFELSRLQGQSVALGWGRVAIEKTIRGAVGDPVLHFVVPAGNTYRFGRRECITGHRTATFIAPGWEFTRRSPPGAAFALSVDHRRLYEEVEARRPGRRGELLFRSRCIELGDLARGRLVSAAADVVRAMGPAGDEGQLARSEAQLIAALADVLMGESAVARTQATTAARITEVETWVDAHLDKPITVGRLCKVAGVGERALQKVFESRRGISPMRFVIERRLAAARGLLTSAGPDDDVTSVAIRLGFGHTGRFAALYRHAYGEAPSQSLRRAIR